MWSSSRSALDSSCSSETSSSEDTSQLHPNETVEITVVRRSSRHHRDSSSSSSSESPEPLAVSRTRVTDANRAQIRVSESSVSRPTRRTVTADSIYSSSAVSQPIPIPKPKSKLNSRRNGFLSSRSFNYTYSSYTTSNNIILGPDNGRYLAATADHLSVGRPENERSASHRSRESSIRESANNSIASSPSYSSREDITPTASSLASSVVAANYSPSPPSPEGELTNTCCGYQYHNHHHHHSPVLGRRNSGGQSNSNSTESISSFEEIAATPVNTGTTTTTSAASSNTEESTTTGEGEKEESTTPSDDSDFIIETIPPFDSEEYREANRRYFSRNQNDSPVKTPPPKENNHEDKLSLDSKNRRNSFRRSLPAGLVVSNIAPCFARLKQIVSSVRRSRSSSARMSVSGTKRKSSPPTLTGGSSNGAGSSSSSTTPGINNETHDTDDSPANPTKMRRRQYSQPASSTSVVATPSASNVANYSSTSLASVLSKYFDSATYAYAPNAAPVGASCFNLQQSLSRQLDQNGSGPLIPPQSRLRKNRTKDSSVVTVIPWSDIQKKEFELPYKLRVQLDQTPIPHEEQLKHSWNDQDKSLNIVLLPHTNSLVFRRYPVAQSTDCIRGKVGFTSGLHVWHIKWPSNQRGTHAVIGVATKDAPLHCSGYKSLIGSNAESWGWDIGRSKLMHDYTNNPPSTYPASILDKDEVLVVPEKITVILDMDLGTLAYMIDGQYLGVAFSGLNTLHKPLYPIVSAVWGHCEVEMSYIHAPQGTNCLSSLNFC